MHQQILFGAAMTTSDSTLKTNVKEKYGQAALRVSEGATATSCCGSSACCGATTEAWDPITSDLYDEGQKERLPTLIKRLNFLEDKLAIPEDQRIPDKLIKP
jgi:hypothetical protein